MKISLEDKLARILAQPEQKEFQFLYDELRTGYIASLSAEELLSILTKTVEAPASVRKRIRRRMRRVVGDAAPEKLPDLIADVYAASEAAAKKDPRLRSSVDALHSSIFEFMPPPLKQEVLSCWQGRGTRGAGRRWLKAIRAFPEYYETESVLAYWRATGDPEAAKSLAYCAPKESIGSILDELIFNCSEGWIISKAVLRGESISNERWSCLRETHPASYLYLCAKKNVAVAPEEAFNCIAVCTGSFRGNDRSLAIWACGQIGLIEVLDQVRASAQAFFDQDYAEIGVRIELDQCP